MSYDELRALFERAKAVQQRVHDENDPARRADLWQYACETWREAAYYALAEVESEDDDR